MHALIKPSIFVLAAAVWLSGACGSAYADTVNFEYSVPLVGGGTVSASGTLTGDLDTDPADCDPNTCYLITGITGSRDYNGTVEAITGLIAPDGFGSTDNLLYIDAPFLDIAGIAFTVDGAGNDGEGDVNVYYTTYGYTEIGIDVGFGPDFAITPEPSTIILLFGFGLAGLAVYRFRRSQNPGSSHCHGGV